MISDNNKSKTDLAQWVGKTETLSGRVSLETARGLNATLDGPWDRDLRVGDPVPELWHWSAFLPDTPTSELSSDGHPQRGGFLPPVELPRRMWAGGSVDFKAPILIESDLRRRSRILSVDEKSASMVFVKVAHEVFQNGLLALSEIHDIVYLKIPERYSPPRAKPVPEDCVYNKAVALSETLLFRYSAVTFNAHRIHYDLKYCQEVEMYPGLVVHGPLQATLLLQAGVACTGHQPTRFEYRGIHPMFHDDDLHVFAHSERDAQVSLCTGVPGSHQGMQATFFWEKNS